MFNESITYAFIGPRIQHAQRKNANCRTTTNAGNCQNYLKNRTESLNHNATDNWHSADYEKNDIDATIRVGFRMLYDVQWPNEIQIDDAGLWV